MQLVTSSTDEGGPRREIRSICSVRRISQRPIGKNRWVLNGSAVRRVTGCIAVRCASSSRCRAATPSVPHRPTPKYGLLHSYLNDSIRLVTAPEKPSGPFPSNQEDDMASMGVHEIGPMLTASEVANLLHLHVNTVKRLGDRGELPFYRVCKRGDRRFRLDDVMQFLAKNR